MPHIVSFKPFLFNAYYDWYLKCGFTPHLLIDANVDGVQVPRQYVREGQIVLSIAPGAIADFHAGSRAVFLKAMFSGRSEDIVIPYKAMTELIAREQDLALPLAQALEAFDVADKISGGAVDDDDEEGAEEPEFSEDSEESEDSSVSFDEDKPDAADVSSESDDAAGFEFVSDDEGADDPQK